MTLLKIQRLLHEDANERNFHRHAEGQFFIVNTGVASVETENGRWVMPSGCIGWIPPNTGHGASVHGAMIIDYGSEVIGHGQLRSGRR